VSRSKALKAVYLVLERNEELTTALKHKAGAKTVDKGARILGDSIYIDSIGEKLPVIIMKVPATDRMKDGLRRSEFQLEVHGNDIFEIAEILDLLEAVCTNYTNNLYNDLPVSLNRLSVLGDAPFDSGDPTLRIPLSTLTLEVLWIAK
jgi:hypothetical protein